MLAVQNIFSKKDLTDSGIKRTGTELLLLVVERIPLLVKKNPTHLKNILEMIFA